MRQWIGSALIQIMACRLFGAKPLSKPNAGTLSIGPLRISFSEILIKIQNFSFSKNPSENVVCTMAAILSRGDGHVVAFVDTWDLVKFLYGQRNVCPGQQTISSTTIYTGRGCIIYRGLSNHQDNKTCFFYDCHTCGRVPGSIPSGARPGILREN